MNIIGSISVKNVNIILSLLTFLSNSKIYCLFIRKGINFIKYTKKRLFIEKT